jgi:outer membrane lipoprotein-sorting protein
MRLRGAMLGLTTLLALAAGPAARSQEPEASPPEGSAPLQEPSATAEFAAAPDTWYAQALARSSIGLNVTHFWSKGDKLRTETVIAGHRIITIVNGDTYYAYDGIGLTGIALGRAPRAVEQDAERERPFGNELDAVLRQGAEKVGVEQLGGRKVELFRVTDELGRRQVWITADELRLPLRLEVYRRQTGRTLETDFLNWQRGLPISDRFFLPESGITFLRLSFDEYVARQADRQSLGPVPVLYTDLLHGH